MDIPDVLSFLKVFQDEWEHWTSAEKRIFLWTDDWFYEWIIDAPLTNTHFHTTWGLYYSV